MKGMEAKLILLLCNIFVYNTCFSFTINNHHTPTIIQKAQTTMSSTSINTSRLSAVKPKLVVLDLDNTLWEPELYQVSKLCIFEYV